MNRIRYFLGLGACLLAAPACLDGAETAPDPTADRAAEFQTLQVAEDFTFAMRQDVRLHLEASDPQTAKYVEVADDEGRRLFAGAIAGDLDLDFDVRSGGQPILQLRVGKGDGAETRTVSLEQGRGSASY